MFAKVHLRKRWLLILAVLTLPGCAAKTPEEVKQEKQDVMASEYNIKLGMAYLRTGQINRARVKLIKALKYNPRSAEANTAMGYFKEQVGENEEARGYYEAAVKLAPTTGTIRNNYGTFLCRQGEYRLSIEQFQRAISDPTYKYTAGALENAGICALKIPDPSLAKSYFERALRNNPKLRNALLKLARLNIEDNHYAEANGYLKQFKKHYGPTAESTWLSYLAAKGLNDTDAIADELLLLKTKFPQSEEFQGYLKQRFKV